MDPYDIYRRKNYFPYEVFLSIHEDARTDIMLDKKNQYTVYPVKFDGPGFYYVSHSTGKLTKIERFNRSTLHLTVRLTYNNDFPDEIEFSFHKKKISFTLNRIEQ